MSSTTVCPAISTLNRRVHLLINIFSRLTERIRKQPPQASKCSKNLSNPTHLQANPVPTARSLASKRRRTSTPIAGQLVPRMPSWPSIRRPQLNDQVILVPELELNMASASTTIYRTPKEAKSLQPSVILFMITNMHPSWGKNIWKQPHICDH